jgi:hypothetical protein
MSSFNEYAKLILKMIFIHDFTEFADAQTSPLVALRVKAPSNRRGCSPKKVAKRVKSSLVNLILNLFKRVTS